MQNSYQSRAKAKLIATCVTLVVIAAIVLVADHMKTKPGAVALSSNSTPSASSPAPAASSTTPSQDSTGTAPSTNSGSSSSFSGYKDGTYTASSNYYVPHGSESIQVTLTVQNGVVTNSSINNSENDGESARFQEEFAADYKRYVVGQKLSSVSNLSIIAGASDTTQGFDDAVSQIISKAQA